MHSMPSHGSSSWNCSRVGPWGRSGRRGLGTELLDHTADSEGRYNLILAHQPAVGGEEGFKVRVCRVISLAELFFGLFSNECTAHELYAYYANARRLVLTKPHSRSNPARRRQVVAHHQSTGR